MAHYKSETVRAERPDKQPGYWENRPTTKAKREDHKLYPTLGLALKAAKKLSNRQKTMGAK